MSDISTTASTLYGINDDRHPANVYVKTVTEHIGNAGESWVKKTTGRSGDWCAHTVMATAIASGLSGKVFPKYGDKMPYSEFSLGNPGGIASCMVSYYNAKRLNGAYWGGKDVVPSTGDLIIFIWKSSDFFTKVKQQYNQGIEWRYYSSCHIGIVDYFKDGTVHTVEGNTPTLRKRQYKQNDTQIAYYIRPDWTKSNGITLNVSSGVTTTTVGVNDNGTVTTEYVTMQHDMNTVELYTSKSTRIDASIRELSFLDSNGQPTTSTTGIRLAAINYTGLLGSVYNLLYGTNATDQKLSLDYSGASSTDSSNDNIDKLDQVPRIIVSYLIDKGLPTSSAIGFIGNIKHDSNFKTDKVGGNGKSFGICQWTGTRALDMKNVAGFGWANNLTGQLNFLWKEMTTKYTDLLAKLKSTTNDLTGVKSSAESIAVEYMGMSGLVKEISERISTAEQFWSKVVPTSVSTVINDAGVQVTSVPGVQKAKTGYGELYLTWPITSVAVGKYSSPYGYRGDVGVKGATQYHNGVDIGSPSKTPVLCCAPGTVYKNSYTDARGYYIAIDHGNKFWTLYQHLYSAPNFKIGDRVRAGETIGFVGATGLKGMKPHLHLEVHSGSFMKGTGSGANYRSTSTVNPAQYFATR